MKLPHRVAARLTLVPLASLALLSACSMMPVSEGPPRKETIQAVTATNQLISFNAGQPSKLLSRKALTGLQPNETLLGIDYRVAKGQLYGLGSSGRLYRIDTESGAVSQIGAPLGITLSGTEFGVDFNPVADRVRVVSNSGLNLRLHPDTGVLVDGNPNQPGVQFDGALAYDSSDARSGQVPVVVAAAYTYNKTDEKLTTNFAIDAGFGTLVTQGSREGVTPVVSFNTGRLYTVGKLGVDAFERAAFDISDLSNAAFAALSSSGSTSSRWVEINLQTGAAKSLGNIGGGETVRGIAIEP